MPPLSYRFYDDDAAEAIKGAGQQLYLMPVAQVLDEGSIVIVELPVHDAVSENLSFIRGMHALTEDGTTALGYVYDDPAVGLHPINPRHRGDRIVEVFDDLPDEELARWQKEDYQEGLAKYGWDEGPNEDWDPHPPWMEDEVGMADDDPWDWTDDG